ncbi:PfkB family carbohydrate kinase [Amnibacterium sp. CER49]|uniref:1-phosphofructokinase family hexose kinase n=1 Tax=Amnibacterium sp. CER49 TaxID=3039161 RepID=UPI002449A41D|nr:PfkB family carbohydrate kinase [Amnibacterium sp. CER49]MDH2443294.1 PfkB family carbohydrate kinase [Amnibacterium sp. CER49]
MSGVVTLTPAPVLDRTYLVSSLAQGKVNRAVEVHEYMSGKGLNVARTLHLARVPVAAVMPIGRDDEHLLFRTPSPHILRIVPILGRIRVNTAIVEGGGRTTNVNQSAIPMSSADWARVVDLAVEQLAEMDADWLVVSGVHPFNSDTNDFVDMTDLFERTRETGARVALDTSGVPLERWTRSGLVNLIKPNADELANLVGRNLVTVGEALDAGRELNALGVEVALVSLGADGALAVTADDAVWGAAVAPSLVNTTGAGDATLAGFLSDAIRPEARIAGGTPPLDLAHGLGTAVSWGALAVSLPTTLISGLEDAPVPVVQQPDPKRELLEGTHLLTRA